MITQKILSTLILLTCSLYYCQNTQQNQLVNKDINYSTEQNKTNNYMLFNNSGQGSMTKIYNTDTGQIKFMRTINNSYIQIISE